MCCVLSGTAVCVGPITRPEKSYRVWCVWVWSQNPNNEEAVAHYGLFHRNKKSTITAFSAMWLICPKELIRTTKGKRVQRSPRTGELLNCPEYEGSNLVHNFSTQTPIYMLSHRRISECSRIVRTKRSFRTSFRVFRQQNECVYFYECCHCLNPAEGCSAN